MDSPDARVAVMYEVARAALGARSLQEVVYVALAGVARLVPAERHAVGLFDLRERTYTLYDTDGVGEASIRPGTSVSLSEFPGDLARLRRGRVDRVRLRGVTRHMAPIRHEGLLLGTLNIDVAPEVPFRPDDDDVALELAHLLGEALGAVDLRQELAAAHDRARRASEAKTTFLAQMSHELRTPLNAILGFIELIREEDDGATLAELRPDVDRIHQSSLHLLGVINDVLDLARIEAGRLEVTLTPVDVHTLLHDLEATVQPLVARRDNVYRWRTSERATVMADPLRLRQILLNLIGNAAKFTGQGVVSVEVTERSRDTLRITVADTGVGIAHDKLAGLFDPFTQAHDRNLYGGSGLGLAISQQYAELMGARIRVESEVGVGSRFWLELDRPPFV